MSRDKGKYKVGWLFSIHLTRASWGERYASPVSWSYSGSRFCIPGFFGTVSEDTLKDIGEGSKTIDQETLRQLRQNNLGPAEMLLPLTSLSKQKKIPRGH